jgi:hypothetical protein
MPTRALTVAAVERIKPPSQGQADWFDKGFPGLASRLLLVIGALFCSCAILPLVRRY